MKMAQMKTGLVAGVVPATRCDGCKGCDGQTRQNMAGTSGQHVVKPSMLHYDEAGAPAMVG